MILPSHIALDRARERAQGVNAILISNNSGDQIVPAAKAAKDQAIALDRERRRAAEAQQAAERKAAQDAVEKAKQEAKQAEIMQV